MREPYFPAASIHLTQSVCFTDGYHEDSFLKGAVPYFIQKSIALFRRFVLIFWNSLISIAITLIVSVTASRRVPRTNRMSLLLPLDSPLSRSYLALRQSFQKKNGFRLFVKPLLYFPSGVCPYLFCDIIISSILHNVKCYFTFFMAKLHEKNHSLSAFFPLFKAWRICYNGIVRCILRPCEIKFTKRCLWGSVRPPFFKGGT